MLLEIIGVIYHSVLGLQLGANAGNPHGMCRAIRDDRVTGSTTIDNSPDNYVDKSSGSFFLKSRSISMRA